MESEYAPAVKEVNGINLDNYFLYQRDFGAAVYVHKKFLHKDKVIKENNNNKERLDHSGRREKKVKYDRGPHFDIKDGKTDKKESKCRARLNNESVLEQTIRFAKNLVPLVMPPSRERSPVFYTVKSMKKSKSKPRKYQESSVEQDVTYEKPKPKKVLQTFRKQNITSHRESLSIRESVSHSSRSNTLDDVNINHSLSCTVSEVSEKKYYKTETSHKRKRNDTQKFVVSESFEALATDNISGETKIKIHLMNDKDKNLFSESIRVPVLNAIKDCLSELKGNDMENDVKAIQKHIKCNTKKLDSILDKLACIEMKLHDHANDINTQNLRSAKASKLEQLSEDLVEEKEIYGSEEELSCDKGNEGKSSVVAFVHNEEISDKRVGNLACGEDIRGPAKMSMAIGARTTDNIGRLPARFCWTDTARKN